MLWLLQDIAELFKSVLLLLAKHSYKRQNVDIDFFLEKRIK